MPFDGSGIFTRVYNWVNDKNASIDITASRVDTEDDGFATGLSTCITKDGQTTVTADLPMATFKHTGVGNADSRNQYSAVGQIQDSSFTWIAGGGTVDVITATYSPAVTALVNGMKLSFRALGANATTTPTFSPNGVTAHTITKRGGTALAIGDISGALSEYELRYNLANTRWELLNPNYNGMETANGQVAFPATQNASSDANTLDDYEEGPWTPVVTFVTPGNLSVSYATQFGVYQKVGKRVTAEFNITTSAFTHTSASGNLKLTGLPIAPVGTSFDSTGSMLWSGITKASYTQVAPMTNGTNTFLLFSASGSAQAISAITTTDTPTGGTVNLRGYITYEAAS